MDLKQRAKAASLQTPIPTKSYIRRNAQDEKSYARTRAKMVKILLRVAQDKATMLGCQFKLVEKKHRNSEYRDIIQLWDNGQRVIDCVLVKRKGLLKTRWQLYSLVNCYRCGSNDKLLGTRIVSLASLNYALEHPTKRNESCTFTD